MSNSHLRIYGKMLQKSPCIPRRAQPTLSMTCVKSKYGSDVKSRDEKEWNARGRKKEEKQNMRNCRHFRYLQSVWFACAFSLSHYLNKMGEEEEEGTKKSAYHNERLQQFSTTPVVITSIPLPSVFLDVLTRRNDAMRRTV